MQQALDISGFSTALYSTFWFIEPAGVLFDCGDGASAFLQQKGLKVQHIACSHPDRDHLAGLLQFLQVNSRDGSPTVYYPKDSGSFPALRDFTDRFDPHKAGFVKWQGIDDQAEIEIKPNWILKAYRNRHVPHVGERAGAVKSLSYSLIHRRKKLKAEFCDLPGPEIGQLCRDKGESHIYDRVEETAVTYSADTPIEPPSFWHDPKVLIHEATFLDHETAGKRGQESRHSVLEDVIQMATQMSSREALVLGHFSCRYHEPEIRQAIKECASEFQLGVPVFAVCPGESQKQILSGKPVYRPKKT
ncbi:MAG: MBL fold metallo-hydrolase [Verrucomicrobiota bacterium]